jgi:hypothetical protein
LGDKGRQLVETVHHLELVNMGKPLHKVTAYIYTLIASFKVGAFCFIAIMRASEAFTPSGKRSSILNIGLLKEISNEHS